MFLLRAIQRKHNRFAGCEKIKEKFEYPSRCQKRSVCWEYNWRIGVQFGETVRAAQYRNEK